MTPVRIWSCSHWSEYVRQRACTARPLSFSFVILPPFVHACADLRGQVLFGPERPMIAVLAVYRQFKPQAPQGTRAATEVNPCARNWRDGVLLLMAHNVSGARVSSLAPDVVLANGGPELRALQHATQNVPIVFANAADPVSQAFVAGLARPGGNVTGFASIELGQSAKRVQLLNLDWCGIGHSSRTDNKARGSAPIARHLSLPLSRRKDRFDLLWGRCSRSVPARRGLCGPHSKG